MAAGIGAIAYRLVLDKGVVRTAQPPATEAVGAAMALIAIECGIGKHSTLGGMAEGVGLERGGRFVARVAIAYQYREMVVAGVIHALRLHACVAAIVAIAAGAGLYALGGSVREA